MTESFVSKVAIIKKGLRLRRFVGNLVKNFRKTIFYKLLSVCFCGHWKYFLSLLLSKYPKVYLGPCQKSMMKLFCKNFRKKVTS